jgi:hypothetical protein
MMRQLNRSEAQAVDTLRRELGIELASIRPRSVQQPAPELPAKDLRLLLLLDCERQHHCQQIVDLFERAPGGRVDLLDTCRRPVQRSLTTSRVRVLSQAEPGESYDAVVAYGSAEVADTTPLTGKLLLLHTLRDHDYLRRNQRRLAHLMQRPRRSIGWYNLFAHTIKPRSLGRFRSRLMIRAAIDWPPNLPVAHDPASVAPCVDYLVLGGKDRDYRLLYQYRALLAGRSVVLTHCDDDISSRQRPYLELLQREPGFVAIGRLPSLLYCRLLLSARVVLTLFEGRHTTDYTCLSEAMWYGIPIITNRVAATRHLRGVVSLVKNQRQLGRALERLDGATTRERCSQKLLRHARQHNNLDALLLALYHDI